MSKPVNPNISSTSNAPIGIDFGTTNSAISRYVQSVLVNGPENLNFPLTGNVLYPSAALLDKTDGSIKTGAFAYSKRFVEPENVVLSVKRKLTEATEYTIDGAVYKNVNIASSIIADLIKEIKTIDPLLHPKVVVVTVPYHFGEIENALIKQAAQKAIQETIGDDVDVFLFPEPVAASLAAVYQISEEDFGSKIMLIYDIGGGTLDFALVRVTKNENIFNCEVLANDGIAHFGGDDIDQLLYDYIVNQEKTDFSALPHRQQLMNKAHLLSASQEAKQQLSFSKNYSCLCTNLYGVEGGFLERVLSRNELDALLKGQLGSKRNMLGEFSNSLNRLYAKAAKTPESVDCVIPVGGSALIPLFRDFVKQKHVHAKEITDSNNYGRFVMVANGAAIYAAIKNDELYGTNYRPFNVSRTIESVKTRIPHSIFLQKYNGKLDLLIPANSVSPTRIEKTYYPTKIRSNGQTVELNSVAFFQGVGDSRKQSHCIGEVDFSGYTIYSHGRCADEIPIRITIEASDTLVTISCKIPKSNKDKKDIVFVKTLML